MNEWSHPDADRVRKELCEADDTISAAVERVIRAEARAEAHASRSVKAEAAQAVLESCIGVRGHVLLAYGDTFAQIAGLLDVPIAGLPPEEAGPRLVAAVEAMLRRAVLSAACSGRYEEFGHSDCSGRWETDEDSDECACRCHAEGV
jgi:hypothetical protein